MATVEYSFAVANFLLGGMWRTMSIYYSFCLLVSRSDFLEGISKPFQDIDITNTRLDYMPHKKSIGIDELIDRLENDSSSFLYSKEAFRLSFNLAGEQVVLWSVDTMQNIFEITNRREFLLLSINMDFQKNLNFIPLDKPLADAITIIANHFKAVYGWMEPDFHGTSEEYSIWKGVKSFPISFPPWHMYSTTKYLNTKLQGHISEFGIDLKMLSKFSMVSEFGLLLSYREVNAVDDLETFEQLNEKIETCLNTRATL